MHHIGERLLHRLGLGSAHLEAAHIVPEVDLFSHVLDVIVLEHLLVDAYKRVRNMSG